MDHKVKIEASKKVDKYADQAKEIKKKKERKEKLWGWRQLY